MSSVTPSVPDPRENPNSYLSYSVQDQPDVSYRAYLHAHGQHDSWWNRKFSKWSAGTRYEDWKEQQLQNYKNYLESYDINYNSEYARRLRLEQAGFSGQYLANGIGGTSSSASPGLAPHNIDPSSRRTGDNKGLQKVMESLQLMSSAGIAMKNFGEGKAAMQYASSIAGGKSSLLGNQSYYWSGKGQEVWQDFVRKSMENKSFTDLGIDYDQKQGIFFIKDQDKQTPNLQKYVSKLNSDTYKLFLYEQQYELNKLTYDNRKAYEGEIMRLQKELLEGKKDIQQVEYEYADWVKKAGLGYPILKMGLESLKLFL